MICAKQTKSIWLVSILVSICLAVVFCPLLKSEAWAATGELKNYKAYLIDSATGDMAYFGTFNDAWGDAIHRQLDSFTVGLLDDQHIYREYGLSFKRSANVELNGHKLFKENNKNHADGGIFSLGSANLTIYGGRQSWTFDGPINNGGKAKVSLPAEASNRIAGEYYDENGFAQASGTESKNTVWNLAYSNIDKSVKKAQLSKNEYAVKGGLISGGWKTDGGAIAMSGRGTVAIYDVTLAGNTGDNNGGAIAMLDSYERLTLTNSRIAFNRARCDDGGGIFVKGDYCRVKMVRSHLDYNYANDNGGIAITGKNVQITGDASALHPADPEYPANWASGTYTDHPYYKLSAKENPFWKTAPR